MPIKSHPITLFAILPLHTEPILLLHAERRRGIRLRLPFVSAHPSSPLRVKKGSNAFVLSKILLTMPSQSYYFIPSEDEAFDSVHPSSPLRVKRGYNPFLPTESHSFMPSEILLFMPSEDEAFVSPYPSTPLTLRLPSPFVSAQGEDISLHAERRRGIRLRSGRRASL